MFDNRRLTISTIFFIAITSYEGRTRHFIYLHKNENHSFPTLMKIFIIVEKLFKRDPLHYVNPCTQSYFKVQFVGPRISLVEPISSRCRTYGFFLVSQPVKTTTASFAVRELITLVCSFGRFAGQAQTMFFHHFQWTRRLIKPFHSFPQKSNIFPFSICETLNQQNHKTPRFYTKNSK